jgi:hypothetical protein
MMFLSTMSILNQTVPLMMSGNSPIQKNNIDDNEWNLTDVSVDFMEILLVYGFVSAKIMLTYSIWKMSRIDEVEGKSVDM